MTETDSDLDYELKRIDIKNTDLAESVIANHIDDLVDPVFQTVMNHVGATSGDIDPMQKIELDEAYEKIAKLVLDVSLQNAPKEG